MLHICLATGGPLRTQGGAAWVGSRRSQKACVLAAWAAAWETQLVPPVQEIRQHQTPPSHRTRLTHLQHRKRRPPTRDGYALAYTHYGAVRNVHKSHE